jgi:hypothetical protein
MTPRTTFMYTSISLPHDLGLRLLQTCAIALPAEITAAAVLIRFWDHDVCCCLLVFLLTDLALAVQPRLDLHRGLDCRSLQCQYFGAEVRIRCRLLIPSDLNFLSQVFWS